MWEDTTCTAWDGPWVEGRTPWGRGQGSSFHQARARVQAYRRKPGSTQRHRMAAWGRWGSWGSRVVTPRASDPSRGPRLPLALGFALCAAAWAEDRRTGRTASAHAWACWTSAWWGSACLRPRARAEARLGRVWEIRVRPLPLCGNIRIGSRQLPTAHTGIAGRRPSRTRRAAGPGSASCPGTRG
jgi:hypothetical protein